MPVHALSLIVRWAHVAGMAAILGGALLVWLLSARRTRIEEVAALQVAEQYEWVFWGAIGVQVATGVGNLGAFGDALPAPGSTWGLKLVVKLLAVSTLAIVSVPRTFAVAGMAGGAKPKSQLLPVLYGSTTVLVVCILGLAVWLAHG